MSLLKRPNVLNNSFAKETDQSLNRSGFKSALNRSGSKSPLNRSGIDLLKRTSSASNIHNPLKFSSTAGNLSVLNDIRRKSDSPDRRIGSPTIAGTRNGLLSASSSDGFSFKKRIADSVAGRLEGAKDGSRFSPRSAEGKLFSGTATSDIWGLQSTNPNSLRQSRTTLFKSPTTIGRPSASKEIFQSSQIGKIGGDLEASMCRSLSPARSNNTTRLLEQSTLQPKMLSAYRSRILNVDMSPRSTSTAESPYILRQAKANLLQNPLLSSNISSRMSHTEKKQRHFLCSVPTDASASLTNSCRLSYSPYYDSGRDTVRGLNSLNDDLRRIRADMHANMNDRTYRPSTQFSKPLSVAEAKRSEDVIDRLFDIAPERWMHNVSRPVCEKRTFGKAVPTGRVQALQETLMDAPDRDFDNLSSNHIGEMLKLSSIIVKRVKESSYYHMRS